ncbi:hypothetical protein QAD02_005206 [Eretmocerus hayati]|uniref:Uncharacterized protein n=1 Tax=Eretmocerus hayati TaxID=131215 RepID=A0ACC2NRR5_9HYME|nr:hypothetical protein QAD02_005206 [Eretmocerus hayati]
MAENAGLLPCSFQFHEFHDEVGQLKIYCQFMKMEKSLFLWVGDYAEQSFNDLALAFMMDSEQPKKPVLTTKIMGPVANEVSINLATRLSKKSGLPVYVSFNITVDNLSLPNVERRINEELSKHPELLNS